MTEKNMVLITGGTGNIGQFLVHDLAKTETNVRVLSRNPAKARQQLPETVEVVQGDLSDRDALAKAFAGVEHAFLLSAGSQDTHLENNLVELAKKQGLAHLVKLSAQERGDRPPDPHAAVEARIKSTGMSYTFLRPVPFMQNMLWRLAPTIRTQDRFVVLDPDATIGLVDVRDIAATAAQILRSPDDHRNRAYMLTGPETMTYRQMAGVFSEVLQRPIAVEQMSTQPLKRHLIADVSFPEQIVPFLLSIESKLAAGWSAIVTDHIQQVTGQPPRSFEAFVRDYVDQFVNTN